MSYFETYVSATVGAGGNQVACPTGGMARKTRVFYRMNRSGTFAFSLLFSDQIDSTFADGSLSRAGLLCADRRMRAAVSVTDGAGLSAVDCAGVTLRDITPLTFGGQPERTPPASGTPALFDRKGYPVPCGDTLPYPFFASDPVTLTVRAGEYLCLEAETSGETVPVLRETLMPSFSYDRVRQAWVADPDVPTAAMVGISDGPGGSLSDVTRVAFLGDSITEGLGTPANAYDHWCAYIADALGEGCACWNLGIGYGRAADAARRESWLWKAAQADVVTVCFGVNDIFRGYSSAEIQKSLAVIVRTLKGAGRRVILMTLPPIDAAGDRLTEWLEVNRYVRDTLGHEADALFDFAAVVGAGEYGERAPYGLHPNPEGCRRVADAFLREIKILRRA